MNNHEFYQEILSTGLRPDMLGVLNDDLHQPTEVGQDPTVRLS